MFRKDVRRLWEENDRQDCLHEDLAMIISQLIISIESKIDGEADVSVLEADFDEFGRDLELARSQISDGKYESFKQGVCCVI